LDAAKLPGAPNWLTTLAADFLGTSGERDTARKIWRTLYAQSEEGPLRRNAKHHLEYLDALDLVDLLQRNVAEFSRRHARHPARLDELVRDGLLRSVPQDPAGVGFDYDAAAGVVGISLKSPLARRPLKPRQRT
jgi:hypothetical protein